MANETGLKDEKMKLFMDKIRVDTLTGCWNWTGAKSPLGYGRFSMVTGKRTDRSKQVHRIAWVHFKGPVPEGLEILHLCNNPSCCNVAHLSVGTHSTNMEQAKAAGVTSRAKARSAKLNDESVRAIRNEHKAGTPYRAIARSRGISDTLVRGVVLRKRWGHVL